jgi:hypothetical protein
VVDERLTPDREKCSFESHDRPSYACIYFFSRTVLASLWSSSVRSSDSSAAFLSRRISPVRPAVDCNVYRTFGPALPTVESRASPIYCGVNRAPARLWIREAADSCD